jgi:plastocyanin
VIHLLAAVVAMALSGPSASGAERVVDLRGVTTLAGRPLADAVVWVEAPGVPGPPAPPAVLDQRNLSFSPHVLAVRVGTIVKLPNDDLVFHNVFSFHDGKKFDLGLYPVGSVKEVHFDRPGLSRVFCNIHSQMSAYVMAVDTPFFAVSDRQGQFVIHGLPPGTYTYHAWRPGGGILDARVTVAGADRLLVEWP